MTNDIYKYNSRQLQSKHHSTFYSTMNTFNFLNSFDIDVNNFRTHMSAIRSKLYSMGVCWTDDVQGVFDSKTPFRVILFTRKDNVDFKNPLVKECNGLVFEYNKKWKLLAMPPRAFCTNKVSMKKLNDLVVAGNYEIYEVLDATILTLYNFKGKWQVSSTKGYDIGSTEMVQGMSFMEAIEDLMNTKYCSFKFETLNPEFSYTIALRHSSYHVFDETKHLSNRTKNVPREGVDMNSYLMVIGVANIKNMTYTTKHVPGLPYQNPIRTKDTNVHALTSYARSAYAKYEKAYRLQMFKYKPLYGYILRAKHRNVPDDYSTIYIESELYRALKVGLYKNNQALREKDHKKLVTQMSMNHDRYEQFRIMFQQFEPTFTQLEDAINMIAVKVTERIIAGSSTVDDNAFVNELTEQFKNEPDVTPGIIKDAMYAKRNVAQLLKLLE